jgi:hypothetical protein
MGKGREGEGREEGLGRREERQGNRGDAQGRRSMGKSGGEGEGRGGEGKAMHRFAPVSQILDTPPSFTPLMD